MQGIPLLWQITTLITVLAGVAVVLAVLARASRRDDQDGRFRSPQPRSRWLRNRARDLPVMGFARTVHAGGARTIRTRLGGRIIETMQGLLS
jgi:hypothetical protein